jgi:hypothetical protein
MYVEMQEAVALLQQNFIDRLLHDVSTLATALNGLASVTKFATTATSCYLLSGFASFRQGQSAKVNKGSPTAC